LRGDYIRYIFYHLELVGEIGIKVHGKGLQGRKLLPAKGSDMVIFEIRCRPNDDNDNAGDYSKGDDRANSGGNRPVFPEFRVCHDKIRLK
jgi:hypothetical protein